MRIYTEVVIESEEQAEALPEGSVAMHEDHWPFQKYQGVWQAEDRTYSNADVIGWTTYAPVEVEAIQSEPLSTTHLVEGITGPGPFTVYVTQGDDS